MEAGGHIGPVSTSVLAQEILPNVAKDIPVFVAGGIGRGEAIAAYLEMGAVGVQLGTRFVCANESIAHANFKKAFIRASARDAIPCVQIDPRLPVIPVRALKNQEMVNFAAKQREVAQRLDEGAIEMAEAQLQIEHYWAGALRRAVIDGDVESGLGDGRPVGRHGQPRGARRRDHPGTGRRSRRRAREPRLVEEKNMATAAAAVAVAMRKVTSHLMSNNAVSADSAVTTSPTATSAAACWHASSGAA